MGEVRQSERHVTVDEAAEMVEEQQGGSEPHSATVEAQEGAQRRSWWRRMFGS